MKHDGNVIGCNMNVCSEVLRAEWSSRQHWANTALDAFCPIANGGFKACERILWEP